MKRPSEARKVVSKMDKVIKEVEETIISICEKIRNGKVPDDGYANTVKALASLVEARAQLPRG